MLPARNLDVEVVAALPDEDNDRFLNHHMDLLSDVHLEKCVLMLPLRLSHSLVSQTYKSVHRIVNLSITIYGQYNWLTL